MSDVVRVTTPADVALYRSLFCRVSDAYGEMLPKGPVAHRSPATDQDIEAHLAGKRLLGFYLLDTDGQVDKGIIDVDVPKDRLNDRDAWEEASAKVRAITATLSGHRIEYYVIRSRRRGWHIYVHTNTPVPASIIRRFLHVVVKQARAGNVEIFPKQDARGGENGLGNFVFGPLYGRAVAQGRTVIVDHENGLNPVSDSWELLEGIKGNSMEALSAVVATLDDTETTGAPEARTAPGNKLPQDLLAAVIEKCTAVNRLRWKATEERHLLHEERIAYANLLSAFENGRELVHSMFRYISDYNREKTDEQFDSLYQKPPLCSTLCTEQCTAIRALGKASPIAFAYVAMRGATAMDTARSEENNEVLTFPAHVMSGAAGAYAELYAAHLEAPQHFFYTAFLTCLGALVADRLTLASEVAPQPRLYVLLLGESADDRKSTAIVKTVDFFKQSSSDFPVCWGVGSAEGLQARMEKDGRLLLALDEMRQFVSKCKIEASVLLPCVSTLFESNRYESHTKHSAIRLEKAYLSILAASTIQTYENTWSSQFTDIGFNNRLWLVPGGAKRRFSIPEKISEIQRYQVREKLARVIGHIDAHRELGVTREARALYDEWYLALPSSIHAKRLDTYALRLMALLAANDLKAAVDQDIVKKVIALCDHQFKVRQTYDPVDADNATAKLEEKIRRCLITRGALSDRDLKRFVHANRTGLWVYASAKKNLQSAGELRFDRKTKRFSLVGEGA